jgi:hypothetical protein
LINKYNLELPKSKRISYVDHVCFLKPIEEVIYFSLFTSEPNSNLGNLGIINNISLTNNIFEYGNPIMRANLFDFFYNFQIINDINFFPKNIYLKNNLIQIIDNSVKGVSEIQALNQPSIQLNLSVVQVTDKDERLEEYFSNLRAYEINRKKEIERMVKTIANGNWVELSGTNNYRRLL